MNSRFTDRVSLCSAAAIGLAGSTGHPLGIVAAAGMPFLCLMPGTRKAAFQSTFAYYLASLWPLVPGLERYIRQSATLVGPLALWILTAILLSMPWTIAWTSDRLHYVWRAPLALLATIIPPLGIIGLASPVMGAGYLFPGTAWTGLVAVALLPGILLSTQALILRRRCVVRGLAIGFCIGFNIEARTFRPDQTETPRGWIAVNTTFGDLSQPFRDYVAAQFIQQEAAKTSARVVIFPESVVPRWSAATEAFWHRSLDDCRTRGQILAIGAGQPAKVGIPINNRERLGDLRS